MTVAEEPEYQYGTRKRKNGLPHEHFAAAAANAEWAHEPFYNHALVAFRQGDFQEAFERVEKALEAFPEHAEGLELRKQLVKQFTVL
jgi:tetratricopeptide repeat protein 8